MPNPQENCGPYRPLKANQLSSEQRITSDLVHVGEGNHDTIGMIVLDADGQLAVGGTTNGMDHKVPG